MFAAVVAVWVYILMNWTAMLLPPQFVKSTDCPIRLKRFKRKVGVRWPRTFSRLLRSPRKTTLTDLQHIQNYICTPSNKIFTSYLLVPLQISIITITNVFLRDGTILDRPANQLTFGYFEMIIGTVQKQWSTWLINVKVMCQFQNPLTAIQRAFHVLFFLRKTLALGLYNSIISATMLSLLAPAIGKKYKASLLHKNKNKKKSRMPHSIGSEMHLSVVY